MPKSGPIIIVEDDRDDQELMKEILQELKIPNVIKFFNSCVKVIEYLRTTLERPFLIISDINVPMMTGMQLRQEINLQDCSNIKRIPFVFLTTNADQAAVTAAFDMFAHGYFVKPTSIQELKEMLQLIIGYWKVCRHPNTEI